MGVIQYCRDAQEDVCLFTKAALALFIIITLVPLLNLEAMYPTLQVIMTTSFLKRCLASF